MGPLGCPETSVNNYQPKLLNIPEERKPQLQCGESLKSPTLLRGHHVHLKLDLLLPSYEGAEEVLFTSYYCRPLPKLAGRI